MQYLYNILIYCIGFVLSIVAFFNIKIKKGVLGRKETFSILNSELIPTDQTIWLHCASLGEYEQGLPVFELLRKDFPKHKIIISFFSPSGYEIRKHTPIADIAVYLPLDTKSNAKQFLELVHPELVVFVKYEIWPNFLYELKSRQIKTILISALFRENQIFFKTYGAWMRNALSAFSHIFVQKEKTKELLNAHHFNNVSVANDTRFDRVFNQLKTDNTIDFIEEFKNNKLCIVFGSTWSEGENFITSYINQTVYPNIKFIIAPHNIKDKQINILKNSIDKKVILYSEHQGSNLREADVFIVNTIGMLSKIYNYADIAYVGGAIGKTGLHNTLEPATFGVPIIIGNNYKKFPEASEMKANGGLFSIANYIEFKTILDKLVENKNFRIESGQLNRNYIQKNTGAVIQIINYLRK